MSADSRPDWGRASGALSILTAIDDREAVAPLWSGTPVRGASGPSFTAPSDTAVMLGLGGAAAASLPPPPPPPLQAEAPRRETRPMARTGVRVRITGVNHTFVIQEGICGAAGLVYMSRRAAIRSSRRPAPASASSGEEIHRCAVAREAGRTGGPSRRTFSRAAASPGG